MPYKHGIGCRIGVHEHAFRPKMRQSEAGNRGAEKSKYNSYPTNKISHYKSLLNFNVLLSLEDFWLFSQRKLLY